MGYEVSYTGPQIDQALLNAQGIQDSTNGFIRIESTSENPIVLSQLTNPGNFSIEYYQGGPVNSSGWSPINITIVKLNGILTQIVAINGSLYTRRFENHVYGEWEVATYGGYIAVGPTPPANLVVDKSLWLDTTDGKASIKYYTATGWTNTKPADLMLSTIYDPTGKRTDFYKYLEDALDDASIGTLTSDISNHINDSTIHVTSSDIEKWMGFVNTQDFADAVASLKNAIDRNVTRFIGDGEETASELDDTISDYEETLSDHISDESIHVTGEQKNVWDNYKAAGDHTHELDDAIIVAPSHINGQLPASAIPYYAKERLYKMASTSAMQSIHKDPYHAGDLFKINGTEDVYALIDDSKLTKADDSLYVPKAVTAKDAGKFGPYDMFAGKDNELVIVGYNDDFDVDYFAASYDIDEGILNHYHIGENTPNGHIIAGTYLNGYYIIAAIVDETFPGDTLNDGKLIQEEHNIRLWRAKELSSQNWETKLIYTVPHHGDAPTSTERSLHYLYFNYSQSQTPPVLWLQHNTHYIMAIGGKDGFMLYHSTNAWDYTATYTRLSGGTSDNLKLIDTGSTIYLFTDGQGYPRSTNASIIEEYSEFGGASDITNYPRSSHLDSYYYSTDYGVTWKAVHKERVTTANNKGEFMLDGPSVVYDGRYLYGLANDMDIAGGTYKTKTVWRKTAPNGGKETWEEFTPTMDQEYQNPVFIGSDGVMNVYGLYYNGITLYSVSNYDYIRDIASPTPTAIFHTTSIDEPLVRSYADPTGYGQRLSLNLMVPMGNDVYAISNALTDYKINGNDATPKSFTIYKLPWLTQDISNAFAKLNDNVDDITWDDVTGKPISYEDMGITDAVTYDQYSGEVGSTLPADETIDRITTLQASYNDLLPDAQKLESVINDLEATMLGLQNISKLA